MTELLYQHDSYVQTFPAQVVGTQAETNAIALDRTAFYPGGGGQPHDLGHVSIGNADLPVTRVWRQEEQVWHAITGPLPEVGASVTGNLDWQRRYQLMRTHTALHILCGVVWRDYGAQVTGGNMEPLQGRMDFEFAALQKDLVQAIEASIHAEVQQARDIRVAILPRATAFQIPDLIRTKINLLPEGIAEVRVVDIVGLDLQADGGTHLANTREVGQVRVVHYQSKGKINKRLYIEIEA